MPANTEYVVRETASNLWRNRLMTIAAVLTAAVSLSLVGAALLMRQGAANASYYWQNGTQVRVWLTANATNGEIKAVKTQLTQLPYVDQPCVYRDHLYDYHEAERIVGQNIITSSLRGPSGAPTSFECTPKVPDDVNIVISTFEKEPGVQEVTAPVASIHSMEKVINYLSIGALVISLALVISAVVLILNTIRMAIFARRREVSVMKLVGATNWFIRVPFISEGMIQGLAGSGLAAFIVYLIHVVMDHIGGQSDSAIVQMRLSGWQVVGTDAVVIIVGVAIGSIGSALAIRRFLDV